MNTTKDLVLIVDDEKDFLQDLKIFLEDQGLNVVDATSGEAGLEILKKHSVTVIISDQRMPGGMSGTEFLGRVAKQYPLIPAILLTGYTDLQPAVEGINKANVIYYIQKNEWASRLPEALSKARVEGETRKLKEKAQKMTKEGPTVLTNYQVMSVGIVSAEDKQALLIGGVSTFQMNVRRIDPAELDALFCERFKNLHVLFIDVDQVGWERVPPRPPSVSKGINGKDYPYVIPICSDPKKYIPYLKQKGFYDCLDQDFVKNPDKLSRYLMQLPSIGEDDFKKACS